LDGFFFLCNFTVKKVTDMKYNRVLLKLSGESLMGSMGYGIDPEKLEYYVGEIKEAVDTGSRIGIVIGGGNIFRGLQGIATGMDRVQGDYMGMLATVINSMALEARLRERKIPVKLLSGLVIDGLTEKATRSRAKKALDKGYVVIFAGGTGNPFFTTDTGASLRAAEMEADVLLKGTRVDGVYTSDPEKDPMAQKLDTLTFDEAINKGYQILDITAFTMCRENNIPIIVFDINQPGNLKRVLTGNHSGTVVSR
jgi:uridylate kinase